MGVMGIEELAQRWPALAAKAGEICGQNGWQAEDQEVHEESLMQASFAGRDGWLLPTFWADRASGAAQSEAVASEGMETLAKAEHFQSSEVSVEMQALARAEAGKAGAVLVLAQGKQGKPCWTVYVC